MEEKSPWLKRMLLGGCCGVILVLFIIFLVNFVLNSITWGGAPDSIDIQLTPDWCTAYFGSAARAVAVEFLSVFALGAAVGLATLPFAEEGKKPALLSLAHFVVTGALAQTVGWSYQWLGADRLTGSIHFLLFYVVLYALIWGVRRLFRRAELNAIRAKLGLDGKNGS